MGNIAETKQELSDRAILALLAEKDSLLEQMMESMLLEIKKTGVKQIVLTTHPEKNTPETVYIGLNPQTENVPIETIGKYCDKKLYAEYRVVDGVLKSNGF